MEFTVNLAGHIYTYYVTYKKMRSIIIKIRDGEIIVSCPYGTDRNLIEDVIQQNRAKILSDLKSYVPNISVKDGFVVLYGEKVPLIVRDLGMDRCVLHERGLYVYSGNVEKAFSAYAHEEVYRYTYRKTAEYLKKYFYHPMPEIVVKKYRGRWGSCYYNKNRISYNESLIHVEKELIDYVVMHELCHFLEANHSPAFYRELAARMPDYKWRQERLKEKHV